MRAVDLYDDHPISERRVLAAATRAAGVSGPTLDAADLFPFDQDHYGGVEAVEVLARRAAIGPGSTVLDVCCGLAGPARFLAVRHGCRVVGIELHAGRAAGARRLTEGVGLAALVRVVRADAAALPVRAGAFDACISQEGLLHVEDKAAVLAACHRALRPGGRLAFTDWIATARLGDAERRRLREWMAATTLQTLDGYRALVGRAGFRAVEAEDVTDEWRRALRARQAAYRALGAGAGDGLDPRQYDEHRRIFAFFVELVESGKLGGGRISGTA